MLLQKQINFFKKIKIGFSIVFSIAKIVIFKKRIPIYCEWEITHLCNLDCVFCSTGASSNYSRTNELDTEGVKFRLNELRKMGTRLIHFSGGEPTLKKDFKEIIQHAKNLGMLVFVTSNGSKNKNTLESLKVADFVRISIDGKEELHDELRVKKGSYKDAIETLRHLSFVGKEPIITTIYCKKTKIEDITPLFEDTKDLNTKITFIKMGKAITENHKVDNTLIPSINEFYDFFDKMCKRYPSRIIISDPYLPMLKSGGLDKFGCRAGDVSISIDPRGNLKFPCTALVKYKNSSKNISSVFHSKKVEEVVRKQGTYTECEGCAVRCMGSASSLLQVSGVFRVAKTYWKSMVGNILKPELVKKV